MSEMPVDVLQSPVTGIFCLSCCMPVLFADMSWHMGSAKEISFLVYRVSTNYLFMYTPLGDV